MTMEELRKEVEDVAGKGSKINYSLFDSVEFPEDRDDDKWIVKSNFDEIAVEGKVKIKIGRFEDILENPTNKDLIPYADIKIEEKNYFDHRFFEGVSVKEELDDGTKLLKWRFGS